MHQRRFRRTRFVAVSALLAMVASLAALVASTSSASAAPVTVQVSGDAASRNLLDPSGGAWTFGGTFFDDLKAEFNGDTIGETTFEFVAPIPGPITDAALADIEVFISSAVGGTPGNSGYTADEEAALRRFIQRGGVVIANTNSADFGRINRNSTGQSGFQRFIQLGFRLIF